MFGISQGLDPFCQASLLGFLAVVAYFITLLPTNLITVFPQTKKTKIPQWIFKNRRWIGLLAFFLAFGHGFIFVQKRNFDFRDIKTYWIYFQGISTFIIFTLLAITSNDWSVKRLKKNWKKLQQLTYLAMFILTWHIADKMIAKWTYLTPIAIGSMGLVIILFIGRMFVQVQKRNKKAIKES